MSPIKTQMIFSTLVFAVVLLLTFFLLLQEKHAIQLSEDSPINQEPLKTNRIILYVSKGCSHCAAVEAYLNQNQIQNKISFDIKVVNHSSSNAKELQSKAKLCDLPNNAIGVPFLWDGEKCLIGDKDIIEFFTGV